MSTDIKCVISQPTFLPWIGYFDLVDQADVMVILDDVQFSKQSWQQRNRIRSRAGLEYITVPVKTTGRMGQRIIDCELADGRFVEKLLRTVHSNYCKTRFFADVYDEFSETVKQASESHRLVDLNVAIINLISKHLGVSTKSLRATELAIGGQRGEHVAAICEQLKANTYVSPAGAEQYLLEDRKFFDDRRITVWMHVYEHPEYDQRFMPFMPYASAIDLLFNVGPLAGEVMRSGRRPHRLMGQDVPEIEEGTDADRTS